MLRLTGAVLLEVHDEWAIAERRYLAEGSTARLDLTADVGSTREGKQGGRRSVEPVAGVLIDAADTVASDHDASLNSHNSTGHGR